MSKRMRCLVTGATGFIGANLCRRLIDEGQDVTALIRPSSKRWRLLGIEDELSLVETDLRDADAVSTAVTHAQPAVVYHLATHGAYPFQNDPMSVVSTNVLGSLNLLNASVACGVELFVNTGSSSEYGKNMFARREIDRLAPDSYYAVSKCAQSLLSEYIAAETGAAIVTIRPFSVYGRFEEGSRLMPKLLMAALGSAPIDMVSPDTARDFIHIDDLLDIYLHVDRLKETPGQIFNAGSGRQTTLLEVVETVSALLGRPVDARWGSMRPRIWDTDVWLADISKAQRLLGWRPRLGLHEGLGRFAEWLRTHGQLYAG